jgi:hypothetical protein
MSGRFNAGISLSIVGLLTFGLLFLGYITIENEKQSNSNYVAIQEIKKEFELFEKRFDDRQIVGNQRANITLNEIKEIQNQTSELIQEFNQTNEVERGKAVQEIIDAVKNNTELIKQLNETQ